ncbi:fluoride efflux transporter FluC [Mumia sp. Pv 4-285]|uniref:fluoride efflux transporter FluC n=1 Tax=Mumia qirimensis TaxID=3234852 RepID=UPI00351D31A1
MSAATWVLVGLLGGTGAGCRFLVDSAVRSRWPTAMPWGTIVVNLSGSLLIGVLAGAHLAGVVGTDTYTVAAVGFCGGYTTFSTAMLETVRLTQAGDVRRAALNVTGTLVLTCVLTAVALVGVQG